MTLPVNANEEVNVFEANNRKFTLNDISVLIFDACSVVVLRNEDNRYLEKTTSYFILHFM